MEGKGYRKGPGGIEKCWSVTGEIDGDSWSGDRENVEKNRGERKETRESRGRRMEIGQGLGKRLERKVRERGGNLGNIEELLKRKREGSEKEKREEEEEGKLFQRRQ